MICDNRKCPSGIKTPAECVAIGNCRESVPVRTAMDVLRDPEMLATLLCVAWDGWTPWTAWACRICEDNGRPACEDDMKGCRWNGKEKEMITEWLKQPAGAVLKEVMELGKKADT